MVATSSRNKMLARWRSVPVTALYHLPHTDLILVSHGGRTSLIVSNGENKYVSTSVDVLGTSSIHGFAPITRNANEHVLAVWGAQKIRLVRLVRNNTSQRWSMTTATDIVEVADWILSLCAYPNRGRNCDSSSLLYLNAHNEVRALSCDASEHTCSLDQASYSFVDRRLVMLYSGHVAAIEGRLVVAAGTMFGQVLFEAYEVEDPFKAEEQMHAQTVTRDVFHDHEGSVFGVSVLPFQVFARDRPHYRLASCSDDRTVRVYEIPCDVLTNFDPDLEDARTGFVDFLDLPTATPKNNSGSAMGHESRIWTVSWLEADELTSMVMTFGEDTTAQTWRVKHAHKGPDNDFGYESTTVAHAQSYGYHDGKNIWAACVSRGAGHRTHIHTGGADGSIVSYFLEPTRATPWDGAMDQISSFTIPQERLAIALDQKVNAHGDSVVESAEQVFGALEGHWNLQRTIVSKRYEHPSGEFVGEARLTTRTATDTEYDGEMIYDEEGTFTMATGVTFGARRRYVYRYQRSSGTITAWFVKPDHVDEVDYLFHKVEFKLSSSSPARQTLDVNVAEGYHLCVADHYNATYNFIPGEQGLRSWTLTYDVKGPQKDYIASASYWPALKVDQERSEKKKAAKIDSYRSYTWLRSGECLITTDQGWVLSAHAEKVSLADGRLPETSLKVHANLPSLQSYSLASALDPSRVLIAAANGELFQYSASTRQVELLHSFGSKVVSLITIKPSKADAQYVLVKCLKELGFRLCKIHNASGCPERPRLTSSISKEIPKGFLATSAAFLSNFEILAVGSRLHGLSLWKVDWDREMELSPLAGCEGVMLHGNETTTSIVPIEWANGSKLPMLFATTGRDGMFQIHRLESDRSIVTIHALRWPYGPNLECISLTYSSVLLWGFDGTDFVAMEYSQKRELMRVNCGNAHRNWAFDHTMGSAAEFEGSLVWTQASSCRIRTQRGASHKVLVGGGHGREIKALAATRDIAGEIVATGAEDTDIRLFTVVRTSKCKKDDGIPIRCRATLQRHTNGLTSIKWFGSYLFSAGGKEELFMWRVERTPAPIGLAVRFLAACPKPEGGLLRITDFCFIGGPEPASEQDSNPLTHLAVVYSDSTLRIWRCETSPPTFVEVSGGRYWQNCLTCVDVLDFETSGQDTTLLTAGTDGYLTIWNEYLGNSAVQETNKVPAPACTVLAKYKTHDSAIKAMLVHSLGTRHFIIVTGGDDGAVVVTLLTQAVAPCLPVATQTRIPRAHSAAVNAIALVRPSKQVDENVDRSEIAVASTGSDQRVVTWTIRVNRTWSGEAGADLELQREVYETAVADASGVVQLEAGLFVVGVGMERISTWHERHKALKKW